MGRLANLNCYIEDVPEGFVLVMRGPHGRAVFGPYPSHELAELEAEALRDVIASLLAILGFGSLVDSRWAEKGEPNGE